jgi:hypothetical protein
LPSSRRLSLEDSNNRALRTVEQRTTGDLEQATVFRAWVVQAFTPGGTVNLKSPHYM